MVKSGNCSSASKEAVPSMNQGTGLYLVTPFSTYCSSWGETNPIDPIRMTTKPSAAIIIPIPIFLGVDGSIFLLLSQVKYGHHREGERNNKQWVKRLEYLRGNRIAGRKGQGNIRSAHQTRLSWPHQSVYLIFSG
jgi:hypothetical protein